MKVFISYCGANGKTLADYLVNKMKKSGFDAWTYSEPNYTYGDLTWLEIYREIKKRNCMIVLTTECTEGNINQENEYTKAMKEGLSTFCFAKIGSTIPEKLKARNIGFFDENNFEAVSSRLVKDITKLQIINQSSILEITGILEKLSRLQLLLVGESAKKRIRIQLLSKIQRELQKQWEIPTFYPYQDVDTKTMAEIMNRLTDKLGIKETSQVTNEHIAVIMRIGWTLDKYGIGLTQIRQKSSRYKQLETQLGEKRAKSVISRKTNDFIKRFLFFFYGLDSIYLFYRYMPSSHISKFSPQFHIVSSQYQQIRDEALKELLIDIQQSIAED